jgi:hypothetical protein
VSRARSGQCFVEDGRGPNTFARSAFDRLLAASLLKRTSDELPDASHLGDLSPRVRWQPSDLNANLNRRLLNLLRKLW